MVIYKPSVAKKLSAHMNHTVSTGKAPGLQHTLGKDICHVSAKEVVDGTVTDPRFIFKPCCSCRHPVYL